jgi:hypothetical protein
MEICMLNKLAPSFILASALVGTMMAPSFAGDDKFESICQFPLRVVGAGVGTIVGVPMGAFKDSVKGFLSGESFVAGKLGNEDGNANKVIGCLIGGPVGFVGGAGFGAGFDGPVHGLKSGYSKPFSKDAFTFKDE